MSKNKFNDDAVMTMLMGGKEKNIIVVFESYIQERLRSGMTANKEHEVTVSQALRKIYGKSKPCKVVQQIFSSISAHAADDGRSVVTFDQIKSNYGQLVSQHITKLSPHGWISSLKSVTVTVLFVQFLLEWVNFDASLPNSQINHEQRQDLTKLMIQSLQQLADGVVRSSTNHADVPLSPNIDPEQQQPTEFSPKINNNNNPMLPTFFIRSLLKAINPYASEATFLLSPLWKGICDAIVALKSQQELPFELTQQLCVILADCIRQGAGRMSAMPSSDPKCAFQTRVLCFLLTRLSLLFPMYLAATKDRECADSDDDDDGGGHDDEAQWRQDEKESAAQTRQLMWDLLVQLHGKASSSFEPQQRQEQQQQQHLDTSSSRQLLIQKIDHCISKSLLLPTTATTTTAQTTVDRDFLLDILRMPSAPTNPIEHNHEHLRHDCTSIGKASVLLSFLQQHSDRCDPTLVLTIVEHLVFVVLPKADTKYHRLADYQERLLVIAHQTALVLEATCDKSRSVRCLLLRWLDRSSRTQQPWSPVSQLFMIRLVELHVVGLAVLTSSQSQQCGVSCLDPFLELMCKLWLDSRSSSTFRNSISRVLVRLLCRDTATRDVPELVVGSVRTRTREMVLKHTLFFLHRQRQPTANKNNGRKRNLTAHQQQRIVISQVDAMSIQRVLSVIGRIEMGSPAQMVIMSLNVDMKKKSDLADSKQQQEQLFWINSRSPIEIAVVLWLMTGILRGVDERGRHLDEFQNVAGCSLLEFIPRMNGWFLNQCQRRKNKSPSTIIKQSTTILLQALLYFLHKALVLVGNPAPLPIPSTTIHLQTFAVSQAAQMLLLSSKDRFESGVALSLAFSGCLFHLGGTLSADFARHLLQQLISSVQTVMGFQKHTWAIPAHLLRNVINFASTVPKSLAKGVLQQCSANKAIKRWLRSRLQGQKHRTNDEMSVQFKSFLLGYASKLAQNVKDRAPNSDLFGSTRQIAIEPGSYFLTLSTRDGRTALVVFGPEEESLADIRYMMGDGGTMDDVRQLERVRSTSQGGGCTLFGNPPFTSQW